MNKSTLIAQLRRDEGVVYHPYVDSVGKITIGVGRNLTDVGFSAAELAVLLSHGKTNSKQLVLDDNEVDMLLNNDIDKVVREMTTLPWFNALNDMRQNAMLNMCFNLGFAGLSAFHQTIACIESSNWQCVHDQLLASKWARQVGDRAQRIANAMLKGI
jgi:lysozyme